MQSTAYLKGVKLSEVVELLPVKFRPAIADVLDDVPNRALVRALHIDQHLVVQSVDYPTRMLAENARAIEWPFPWRILWAAVLVIENARLLVERPSILAVKPDSRQLVLLGKGSGDGEAMQGDVDASHRGESELRGEHEFSSGSTAQVEQVLSGLWLKQEHGNCRPQIQRKQPSLPVFFERTKRQVGCHSKEAWQNLLDSRPL